MTDTIKDRVQRARKRLADLDAGGSGNNGAAKATPAGAVKQPVVLTSAIPTPDGTGPASATAPDIVDAALADRLGWRLRTDDPDGFRAALEGSFAAEERFGYSVYHHVPRTFSTQADLGAVTGAQASLKARAAEAVAGVHRAFEGLEPIYEENRSRAEAHRSIVLERLDALVEELGRVGGPRTHIVDDVFSTLVGPDPLNDPEDLEPGTDTELAAMRLEYTLTHEWVSTIEDELRLTNFLTGVDAINALYHSWNFQRAYFDLNPVEQPYLGTQLVLVARALDVVIESVAEARSTLEANFIGEAEQRSLVTNFNGAPLTVADVLEWADDAARAGARTIKQNGREGVVAMTWPLTTLCDAVHCFRPPVGAFPTLYNGNPLIASAIHVLEVNLLRLVTLLEPLDRRVVPEAPPPPTPSAEWETAIGVVAAGETKSVAATISVQAPPATLRGHTIGLVPAKDVEGGELREAAYEGREGGRALYRASLKDLDPGAYAWVARRGDETIPLFITRVTN